MTETNVPVTDEMVEPPKAKYRLTVTITGNTLEEVEEELK